MIFSISNASYRCAHHSPWSSPHQSDLPTGYHPLSHSLSQHMSHPLSCPILSFAITVYFEVLCYVLNPNLILSQPQSNPSLMDSNPHHQSFDPNSHQPLFSSPHLSTLTLNDPLFLSLFLLTSYSYSYSLPFPHSSFLVPLLLLLLLPPVLQAHSAVIELFTSPWYEPGYQGDKG